MTSVEPRLWQMNAHLPSQGAYSRSTKNKRHVLLFFKIQRSPMEHRIETISHHWGFIPQHSAAVRSIHHQSPVYTLQRLGGCLLARRRLDAFLALQSVQGYASRYPEPVQVYALGLMDQAVSHPRQAWPMECRALS